MALQPWRDLAPDVPVVTQIKGSNKSGILLYTRVGYGALAPEALAEKALAATQEPVRYKAVETDGAARAVESGTLTCRPSVDVLLPAVWRKRGGLFSAQLCHRDRGQIHNLGRPYLATLPQWLTPNEREKVSR